MPAGRPPYSGPTMANGSYYSKRRYYPKRNYARPTVKTVEKMIKHEVNKAEWSKQLITTVGFNAESVTNSLSKFTLSKYIVIDMLNHDQEIFSQGSSVRNTDGSLEYSTDIKIDFIRWQLRFSLGESETSSAVSQNVRMLIFRVDKTFEEVEDPANIPDVLSDLDANPKYPFFYGDRNGLFVDKFFYLKSQAADEDTTVGGQVISKGFKKLNYRDTLSVTSGGNTSNVFSEKGQLAMAYIGDNPDGVNCEVRGFIEIGWRHMT